MKQSSSKIQLRKSSVSGTSLIAIGRTSSGGDPNLIALRGQNNLPLTENDIRLAVRRKEFEVYYQSRHHVGSHLIAGFEALVRWNHPVRGLIMPDKFIDVAEQAKDPTLIQSIGSFVLEQSIAQLAYWREEGLVKSNATMGVNVSAVQFDHDTGTFAAEVLDILNRNGLPANLLDIELTETACVTKKSSADLMHELREIGVNIALDDFGTGYAGLDSLNRHPINIIKIDRSYVSPIHESAKHKMVMKGVVALSKEVGLRVVIEGVENEFQMEYMSKIGVDEMQGYLFSKPVSHNKVCFDDCHCHARRRQDRLLQVAA